MTTHAMRIKSDSPNRAARLRLALCMAREAENIGARIKELREERHLTQRELADQLPGKMQGIGIMLVSIIMFFIWPMLLFAA